MAHWRADVLALVVMYNVLEKLRANEALNAERAKEEAAGMVRWLRPDYQNPGGAQPQQAILAVEVEPEAKPGKQSAGKLAWPKTLSERVKAVSTALATVKEPVTAPDMAKRFARARAADVGEILETLCAMGKAQEKAKSPSLLLLLRFFGAGSAIWFRALDKLA